MIKKSISYILGFILSFQVAFAANFKLDWSSLDIFGELFSKLQETPAILDGIAIIIFFLGFFQIANFAFSKVFKGDGAAQARKGASAIFSIFITGALIIHNPSDGFVSFYGGLLLFYIGVAMLFGIYFPWVKKTWTNNTENKTKAVLLISLALLMIIISIQSFATKLFGNLTEDSFTGKFVIFISSFATIDTIIILISLILLIVNKNKLSTVASDLLVKNKRNRDNAFSKLISQIKKNYGDGNLAIKNLWGLYNK